jgi:hypothetical protein
LSSSSSSSSDGDDPARAAVERTESEDAEIATAETVSSVEDVATEASSADESTASSTSSGNKDVEARTSIEEDEVSMDELKAAEAAFDSDSTASASEPRPAEGAVEEHTTVEVVTSAKRAVETTPITIATSGETAQDHLSGSGSHVDPSLLDSSPSTRHYVRRARKGSIVSTDSERTISATVRVPTPPSLLHESGGTASTPVIIAAVTPTTVAVQDSDVVSAAAEEVPDDEDLVHVPDTLEGNNIVDSIPINENLVIGTDSGIGVVQVEHAEVAASEDPAQADVVPGSGIPIIEEELAQGPVDDIDMADAHNSYDEVLAEIEDHMAGAQAADIEVTAPVATHASPTETGIWPFINILPLLLLDGKDFLKCIDKT